MAAATPARAQGVDRASHQVPEPWHGHLEKAPMLVVAMNPAYNPSENSYPTKAASAAQMISFFEDSLGDSNERSRTWLDLRKNHG
jgi:hypothetical protein